MSQNIDKTSFISYYDYENMETPIYQPVLSLTGLSQNQALIYEVLLKIGPSTARKVSQNSPLKRPLTYKVLDELAALDLVLKKEELTKIATFEPLHPTKLNEILEKHIQKDLQAKEQLAAVMGNLVSDFNLVSHKPGVKFFEGLEGIKQAYDDTLKQQTEIFAFVATGSIDPELEKWLDNTYVQKRARRGNKAFVIATDTPAGQNYHQRDEKELRETILTPRTHLPLDMEIDIYGKSKTLFISFKTEEMIAVLMDSKAIHDTMKVFFNLTWQNLKNRSDSPLNSSETKLT